MRAALLVLALVACKPPRPVTEAIATPPEGLAIAMYTDGARTLALVDDRGTVQVRGHELVLDPIAEGVELESLVVEPASAAGKGLVVEACRRESVHATAVRCKARGASGPVFVRIVYVSTTLSFAANHYIVVAGPRASITTTFALELPTWGRRAAITLYDGIPGEDRVPVQLGAITRDLDGTAATIESAEREVQARRLVVFDPMRRIDDEFRDEQVSADLRGHAWEWVELVDTAVPTGSVRLLVDVDTDDPAATEVTTKQLVRVAGNVRIPIRPDEHVRGMRERSSSPGADQYQYALWSTDTKPRHVLVEETLRSDERRRIEEGSPNPPILVDDLARLELEVPAAGTVRARFRVRYEP